MDECEQKESLCVYETIKLLTQERISMHFILNSM
jgi:hypothetical protein